MRREIAALPTAVERKGVVAVAVRASSVGSIRPIQVRLKIDERSDGIGGYRDGRIGKLKSQCSVQRAHRTVRASEAEAAIGPGQISRRIVQRRCWQGPVVMSHIARAAVERVHRCDPRDGSRIVHRAVHIDAESVERLLCREVRVRKPRHVHDGVVYRHAVSAGDKISVRNWRHRQAEGHDQQHLEADRREFHWFFHGS
jgi:hypothetical protein